MGNEPRRSLAPLAGLAGTLNSRSSFPLWHFGQSTVSPSKIKASKVCSHSLQAYSYIGIENHSSIKGIYVFRRL
jgi:hypothetical protein